MTPTLTACRHCHRRKVIRAHGLCWRCSLDPEIRARYIVKRLLVADSYVKRPLPQPTSALPGEGRRDRGAGAPRRAVVSPEGCETNMNDDSTSDLHESADPPCPNCGGQIGAMSDGTWKCIANYSRFIGCGWVGTDDHVAINYLRRALAAASERIKALERLMAELSRRTAPCENCQGSGKLDSGLSFPCQWCDGSGFKRRTT